MKDDLFYIENILQSIDRIQSYISGKDQETFISDFITQDAVVRQLEIIGEATKRVSKDFRNNNQDIPWADMAGMRDILIHDYIDVDANASDLDHNRPEETDHQNPELNTY
jgi:uncharacterized protein with HEPN domain